MPFHLENLNQEPFSVIFFSPSHLTRNRDANRAPRAYICALEAGFSQVAKKFFCQTVGGVFLTFLPKIKDDNSICQTAGDAQSQRNNSLLKKLRLPVWLICLCSRKSLCTLLLHRCPCKARRTSSSTALLVCRAAAPLRRTASSPFCPDKQLPRAWRCIHLR